MLSDSPPERDVQWTEAGIEGASRFLQRVWKLVNDVIDAAAIASPTDGIVADPEVLELRKAIHRAAARVAEEIEGLRFNRAVAHIYELTNALAKFVAAGTATASRAAVAKEGAVWLVQMVAPMMPHLAETAWEALGQEGMVVDAPWPKSDPELLVDSTVVIPVQVNGKRRGEVTVPVDSPNDVVQQQALSLEAVARILDGKSPKKVVIVPNRIINVVA
jgi:leucyl-tRNA synthetase